MSEKQNNKIAEILGAFAELYGKELSTATARMYFAALEEYTPEQLEYAAQKIMKEHALSRFPLPADFIKHLKPSQEEEKLNARTAWNSALRKMEIECTWSTVKFDDRFIHLTIDSLFGGWIEFGKRLRVTEPENLVFVERDFIETYLACKHNTSFYAPIPKLCGRHELTNKQSGRLSDAGILTLPDGSTTQVPFSEGGLDDDEVERITEGKGRAEVPELQQAYE